MKVYTRTGDKGSTSLVGGTRVQKNDPRLDAYGTIDELNALIGLIIASTPHDCDAIPFLDDLQHKLFDLGASLATEPTSTYRPKDISSEDIKGLESEIDRMEESLPRHNRFVLPRGSMGSCFAGLARTVCRRAERIIVCLPDEPENTYAYVNRLSDYLFVLSRYLNKVEGVDETYW